MAQLVEHDLAKVGVAGSSPVSRFFDVKVSLKFFCFFTIKKFFIVSNKEKITECFGYVPLLAMGGKESVNSIKKVKMREHISLIINLVGGI